MIFNFDERPQTIFYFDEDTFSVLDDILYREWILNPDGMLFNLNMKFDDSRDYSVPLNDDEVECLLGLVNAYLDGELCTTDEIEATLREAKAMLSP